MCLSVNLIICALGTGNTVSLKDPDGLARVTARCWGNNAISELVALITLPVKGV